MATFSFLWYNFREASKVEVHPEHQSACSWHGVMTFALNVLCVNANLGNLNTKLPFW